MRNSNPWTSYLSKQPVIQPLPAEYRWISSSFVSIIVVSVIIISEKQKGKISFSILIPFLPLSIKSLRHLKMTCFKMTSEVF